MNLLFPFHSQRTVNEKGQIAVGLPMNLNKHLIICCLTDFKVWWPQDPVVCGYEHNLVHRRGLVG